jgi:hypothetical protein
MSVSLVLSVLGAVVLAIRQLRQRVFAVRSLWIMPLSVLIVVALSFARFDFSWLGALAGFAGLAAGSVLGMKRARMLVQSIDVPGRKILTKANVVMTLFFAATIIVKALERQSRSVGTADATTFGVLLTAASTCAERLQFYLLFRQAAARENEL